MAKIDYNASKVFKDILPELIEYNGFIKYLQELPFQTKQMENKQSLRIQEAESDTIAAIDSAECSYIDNFYYCKTMDEDPFIYYGTDQSKNEEER